MSEHTEQVALIQWVGYNEQRLPDLKLLYAIPNAGKRGKKKSPKTGKWYSSEGGKLKAEGMKAGVPDLCLPVPKGPYCGLYIEMKYGKNKLSEPQEWWVEQLRRVGHRVEVCYNTGQAIDTLNDYFKEKEVA